MAPTLNKSPLDLLTGLSEEARAALLLEARSVLVRHYAALVRTGKKENQHYILDWGAILFPEKFFLPFCHELHDYFCEERDHPFTCDEAPRGHAKTTVKCFLIPIFQALEEPWKYRHYLNIQATEDKALAINSSIMLEIEENRLLKAVYGNQTTKQKWTTGQFVLANGTIFTAVGAGQSLRGIHYRQIRPDYILVDDLYDQDDINNHESTLKKNEWFWGSLYPARAKGKRNAIKLQGTAINEEDLLNKAKTSTQIKHRTFKAITDWNLKTVLWKEHNTFESLMFEMEDACMGSLIFAREYQNERRDDKTAIIKRAWLEDWEFDPERTMFGGEKGLPMYGVRLCCDPSIGLKEENDPTALALIYLSRLPGEAAYTFFIMKVLQDHMSLDIRTKKMVSISQEQAPGFALNEARVEAISGFQDFIAHLKKNTNLPIREITHVKDKISNLESKSGFFENRHVRISTAIPRATRDTLIYQLTTNHPKNDDLRDAVLLGIDDFGINLDWI